MTAEKISLDIDIFSEVFLYLYTRKTTVYMDIYVLASMGSNRTFMELKFPSKTERSVFFFCSNRTFMELKYSCAYVSSPMSVVLIVPLWN